MATKCTTLHAYQFFDVTGYKASSYGIDTNGTLIYTGWAGLLEEATDVRPCFILTTRNDRVLKVISNAINVEPFSLVKHLP